MSLAKISLWSLLALGALACSEKSAENKTGKTDKPIEQIEAPKAISSSPIGVESPKALGYRWGKGSRDFASAETLLKDEARDWAGIAAACQAALAADENHHDAHRLLGIALANTGEDARAAEHLSIALAADWLRWGPELAADKNLVKFFETSDGKGLLALNDSYKERFYKLAGEGSLVVARRTRWARPSKTGKQWAASRAELFAFHLDEERYLRLTHSGESVVGFIHSPDKSQIAVLAVSHYEFPEGGGPAPIASASVVVLDGASFIQVGESARLKKSAPSLTLYYGPGEELLLDARDAVYSVDALGGKLVKSGATRIGDWGGLAETGAGDQPMLFTNSELSRVLVPWGASATTRNTLSVGDNKVELPASGGDAIRRVSWSPDRSRLTFAGIGDPCQPDHKTSIYVVDASGDALKHVHRGAGLQRARWLDADRFIFEAEPGELRVYDVPTKNTTFTIKNGPGIGLAALSNVSSGEHCSRAAAPSTPPPAPPPAPANID